MRGGHYTEGHCMKGGHYMGGHCKRGDITGGDIRFLFRESYSTLNRNLPVLVSYILIRFTDQISLLDSCDLNFSVISIYLCLTVPACYSYLQMCQCVILIKHL